jgi:hypothetical protein
MHRKLILKITELRYLEKKTRRNIQNQIRRIKDKIGTEDWDGYHRRALFLALKQAREKRISDGIIKEEEV